MGIRRGVDFVAWPWPCRVRAALSFMEQGRARFVVAHPSRLHRGFVQRQNGRRRARESRPRADFFARQARRRQNGLIGSRRPPHGKAKNHPFGFAVRRGVRLHFGFFGGLRLFWKCLALGRQLYFFVPWICEKCSAVAGPLARLFAQPGALLAPDRARDPFDSQPFGFEPCGPTNGSRRFVGFHRSSRGDRGLLGSCFARTRFSSFAGARPGAKTLNARRGLHFWLGPFCLRFLVSWIGQRRSGSMAVRPLRFALRLLFGIVVFWRLFHRRSPSQTNVRRIFAA